MAFPTYQAAGAFSESATADISPVWPTHLTNDIGLLLVVSESGQTRLTVPAGFVELPSSPQKVTLGALEELMLQVYWCRATSGAMGAPTVKFVSGHVRACIVTFRG